MSDFRFRSALDDAVFVVVILAGVAVSAAMEMGALRSVFEQKSAAVVAKARTAGGAAIRLVAAWLPRHAPAARAPARIRG